MTTEELKIQELLYQYQYLLSVQYQWIAEWQELADYIIPRKNSIAVNRIPGWKRTQRLFDSTAPHDMDMLAAAIHGTLTPSFTKWFALKVVDEQISNNQQVKNWLDIVNNRIRTEINKSNFNAEGHELYIDMVSFGTGCLYEEEKQEGWWGGLRFSSVPISKYAISEDKDGKADTAFRIIPMSTHAILDKWSDSAPQEVKESEKPDLLWDVIHAVVPTIPATKRDFRWKSTYILFKTRTILSEKGYYEFPFMVPRWTKYADETYGRGPSHTALPDIRTLNKLTEMELRNLSKIVDPPLGSVQGEVVGPARMIPGGITMLKSKEGIFPIDVAGNYQVANLKKEDLRNSIHGIYMIDQLQLNIGPQMTATEVNVRYETMQKILGPTLGRIDTEFTSILINRTFNIMFRAGLFNPLPELLNAQLKSKPISLTIQYEGPLARSQRSTDLVAMQSYLQTMEPIIKVNPDVVDVINFDEIARHTADILGVPSNIIRDEQQVQQARKAKQQVLEQQQKQEQQEQLSQTGHNVAPLIKALGERPKSGSPLRQIQSGQR